MIDINLIPVSLRKNAKAANALHINIPEEILGGVAGSVILLLVIVHLILGVRWFSENNRLSGYNAQWNVVVPSKNQFDAMTKESNDLKKKIAMISDMTVQKSVHWSPKFNVISDSLPRGVWIRKMTLDKTGLTIEGSVVSKNENEINNVGIFLGALKKNNNFMKDFSSLEVNSIQRESNSSVGVTDFTVMAKLK